MSGSRPFVRQLGAQPGVQLNPIVDGTDGAVPDNSDQIFGMIGRFTRGRIDRPFRVNRSNFLKVTGPAASLRASALNEAKLQAYEALQNGAYEAVLQRLSADDAVRKYGVIQWGSGAILTPTVVAGVITAIAVTNGGKGYVTGETLTITDSAGSGAVATITAASGVITAVTVNDGGDDYVAPVLAVNVVPVFSVSETVPAVDTFKLYFDHLDCYNDGIKVSIHADSTPVVGTATANTDIILRFLDAEGALLDQFEGSLDSTAKDDFNQSKFIADIIAARTDSYEVTVAAGATIIPTSSAYGRDTSGVEKYATSGVLLCFEEGTLTYTNTDYDRCIAAMRNTTLPFGYLISGGTQALALLGKLVLLAIETNLNMALDLDGRLSVEAANTLMASLNIDTHYVAVYWTPLECDDPMNGGKAVWGSSGLNIGYRCARNARVNAKGFAPKNYPVAGKEWPLNRTGVRQLVRPQEQELSDLAKSKINPVISEIYNGGAKFVYTDSLTAAKTVVSYKKLISVAEMSAHMDLWIALYSKELLQLPMSEFIKRMNAFLGILLPDAVASKWLVPSRNLPGNAPFQYDVRKSEVRPADLVHISYWTCYDGVARQVIIEQTLVK